VVGRRSLIDDLCMRSVPVAAAIAAAPLTLVLCGGAHAATDTVSVAIRAPEPKIRIWEAPRAKPLVTSNVPVDVAYERSAGVLTVTVTAREPVAATGVALMPGGGRSDMAH
jgi:hypothetical protein